MTVTARPATYPHLPTEADIEASPRAVRLVSLVGTPEAWPLPCLDPLPHVGSTMTPGVLVMWFLHRRATRAEGSDPILLTDGRWLPRDTPHLRKALSEFTASPAFLVLTTSSNSGLRSLRQALEPVSGDYYRVATHTRMLTSKSPGLVTDYLHWWCRNVATALYWTGLLPQETADAVVSRFPDLAQWRRSPKSGKWLDGYTVCRDVYAAVGGTVSSTSALVDEYLESHPDADPNFVRRRLSSAYRMSSTAGTARGSKSDPSAAAESQLRIWLSRATPWLASSAPHLSATWRSHLLRHVAGDVDPAWVHRQKHRQLYSRLPGSQHRVCDAVDGWQWSPDPYPGFRRLSPASPLRRER